MGTTRKPFNPFYALLLVVGVAFTVTACAYGVMTVRDMHATEPVAGDAPGEPLLDLLRQRGGMILAIELGILTISAVGAMATDDYWQRRAARSAAPTSSTKHKEDP